MPVILATEAARQWLEPGPLRPELLAPYLARCTRCELVALTADLRSVKEHSGRTLIMVESAYELACLNELDAMIGRAVAACDRYRQATEQWGLSAPLRRNRRKRLQTMEAMLARLLAQRANEVPGLVPWAKDKEKAA